jgi:LAO/AO transport system kinase
MRDPAQLAAAIAAGDKAAVATALNAIEDRRPEAQAGALRLLAALRLHDGVQRIGLTGPPGVGKSTLASVLARELRERGKSVGVLAVDPSSLRSGGALLGDRARMDFDPADQQLFVRSLATAGATGGLAHAASAAVAVLSAAYQRVLVETVGVGQSETDVEHVVDSVCLVVQPGSGDVLQFIKAGIMEIPDLIVVNKGDHQQLAERAKTDLEVALAALRRVTAPGAGKSWKVPVLVTSARDRTGIEALADRLQEHLEALGHSDTAPGLVERRRVGAMRWAFGAFVRRHGEHGLETLGGRGQVERDVLARVDAGDSPLAIAAALSERYLASLRGR